VRRKEIRGLISVDQIYEIIRRFALIRTTYDSAAARVDQTLAEDTSRIDVPFFDVAVMRGFARIELNIYSARSLPPSMKTYIKQDSRSG